MKKALLIVDVQNDFLPNGSLAVPNGDEIIPIINEMMESGDFDLIVATKDWHPKDHGSFASQHEGKEVFELSELNGLPQVLWPNHCVQGSTGAQISNQINTDLIDKIILKGTNPKIDSYSGFEDNGGLQETELDEYLQKNDVSEVYVCGLATDYCVQFTALDAVKRGYKTVFIREASKGITSEGVEEAIANMWNSNVYIRSIRDSVSLNEI